MEPLDLRNPAPTLSLDGRLVLVGALGWPTSSVVADAAAHPLPGDRDVPRLLGSPAAGETDRFFSRAARRSDRVPSTPVELCFLGFCVRSRSALGFRVPGLRGLPALRSPSSDLQSTREPWRRGPRAESCLSARFASRPGLRGRPDGLTRTSVSPAMARLE